MPAPGELRAARFAVSWHDLVWEWLYRAGGAGGWDLADRLNFCSTSPSAAI